MAAVQVKSVDEEDLLLATCKCGGEWDLAAEDVVPINGRWVDALVVRCRECGCFDRALFDITSFFTPPTLAWTSYAS